MGRIVSKQPNGLYCVFSTIVDDIVTFDLTEEEYIEYRIEKAKKEAREDAKLVLKKYLQPFESVIDYFHPSDEEDLQNFIELLKRVGYADDKIKEFEEKKRKQLEEYDED